MPSAASAETRARTSEPWQGGAVSARFGAQSPDLAARLTEQVAALASGHIETNPVELRLDGFRCTLAFLGEPTPHTRLFHLIVAQERPAVDAPDLTLTLAVDRDGGTGIPAQGEVGWGRWDGLDLTGLALPGFRLTSMTVNQCRLDGANLAGARITDTQFEGVRAAGADLSGASFEGSGWRHGSIHGSNLQGTRWSECTFERWLMSDSQLSGAAFTRCVCLGWVTEGCRWHGARLSACVLDTTSVLPATATPPCLQRRGDLLTAGDTVIVSALAPDFMNGFCEAAQSLGIRPFRVSGGSPWVRDTQFKARLPGPGPAFHVMVAPQNPDGLIAGDPLIRLHHLHASQMHSNGTVPGGSGGAVQAVASDAVPLRLHAPNHSWPLMGTAFTLCSDRFIEGGNMIVIDDDLALVGNDALLHPADLPEITRPPTPANQQSADRAYPGLAAPEARWAIWNQRKLAKTDLTRLLGVQSLLLLPQWAFHIDLQMAYIGPRRVLVHSFKATLDFLASAHDELVASLGGPTVEALVSGNEAMAARWEEVGVNTVLNKLARAGVDAKPVCGLLAEGVNERGVPLGMRSLLVNGLGVDRGVGQNPVFLTAGSPNLRVHEAHFRQACLSMGVDVRYCYNEDPWGDPDPQSFIARQHGGVRCLSNSNNLGWLDVAFEAGTEVSAAGE